MGKMSAEEKKWQAESDARSLMEANKIQSDPARLKKAKAALNTIEAEAKKTQAEAKVARKLKKLGKEND